MGDNDAFHTWLQERRADWLIWRSQGSSLMTFSEYLAARAVFLKEKDRG